MINKLPMLLNVLFLFIFIIHISLIGYKSLYPDVPEILAYKKNLSEIKFPMLLQVCLVENKEDKARFQRLGYLDDYGYYQGQSVYNSSLFGWAGHTLNGSTMRSVDGNLDPITNHAFYTNLI